MLTEINIINIFFKKFLFSKKNKNKGTINNIFKKLDLSPINNATIMKIKENINNI